jgi:hypothetical protein
MKYLRGIAVVLLASAPIAHAQVAADARQKFASIGGIIGVTPVKVLGGSTAAGNIGMLADVGLQDNRFAYGIGVRPWLTLPNVNVGGYGLDGFLFAECRISKDSLTTLRASAGYGYEEFDSGTFPFRTTISNHGFVGSVGIGREMIVSDGGESVVFSADFLIPHTLADTIGRRAPIFEFGVSYRLRSGHDWRPATAPR